MASLKGNMMINHAGFGVYKMETCECSPNERTWMLWLLFDFVQTANHFLANRDISEGKS